MEKREIYIRTCGNQMSICLVIKNKYHYRDYDLENLDEYQKKNISTFMKCNKTLPINIRWEDLQKIRKVGFKI